MTKSRKGRDGYTVSKDGNDWKLTRNHSERASGTFDTQAEAIRRGKRPREEGCRRPHDHGPRREDQVEGLLRERSPPAP